MERQNSYQKEQQNSYQKEQQNSYQKEQQNSYQKEQQNSFTAEHHSKNPYLDMNIPEEFDPHNEELEQAEDSRAVIVITLVLLILGWIPIFGLFFLTYFTASSLEDMEPGEGNIEINFDRNN